jgi:hypothetical protein
MSKVTGQEISKFPLAAASHPHATAMERHHEVSSPSLSGGARPPVISTGGAPLEFWRCRSFVCSWVGANPLSRLVRPEVGEYEPAEITHDLMCPVCRSGVVFAPSCCDCGAHAADLGSERCGACDASAEKAEHEARMASLPERRAEERRREYIEILTGGFR